MLCLKIPRNVPVKSCMKRWEVKSWRHWNTHCVPAWICREMGLLPLQLWWVLLILCQCLSCPSRLLDSAGNVCAQFQPQQLHKPHWCTQMPHWSVHPGMDRWVCASTFPVFTGESTRWAGAENTNSFMLLVFFSGETLIFDKSVLFVYNNGSTQRIFAAAWIPVEDAEEPVHPVSMETHAGGRGCKMTGKEQAEAK